MVDEPGLQHLSFSFNLSPQLRGFVGVWTELGWRLRALEEPHLYVQNLLEDTTGGGQGGLSVVLPLFPSLCFLGFLFEQSRNFFALLSILNF